MPDYYESGFMVDKPAWHGLGTVIPAERAKFMTMAEFIGAAGLNWQVQKLPLYVPKVPSVQIGNGEDVRKFDIPADAQGKLATDCYGVFRDSDWKCLGSVGDRYTPLQNADAFAWFQPWVESGQVLLETAGSLYGGAVVWVMARLNQDEDEILPEDFVRRYILLSTSHDGSQAIYAGFTDIRTVCANTLAMAKKSKASKLLRCKHTEKHGEALARIRKAMDLANQEFIATAADYRKLAACRINRDDLIKYVKIVLGADENDDDDISTRTSNQIDRIVHLHDNGKGAEMAKGTLWGAYNAVTEWLSYERGHNAETRLKSLWFGQNAKCNQDALTAALAMAS